MLSPAVAGEPVKRPSAVVAHAGQEWSVLYTLPRHVRGWLFPVSAPTMADHKLWRQATWRVATPGVRIERRGAYDVLVASEGRVVPLTVRITFAPTSETLEREYDPAVAFSNGAMALYSDQFDIVPVDDLAAVTTKAAGLSLCDFGAKPLPIRFHDDAGPVFVKGSRQRDPILTGASTYVVFGAGDVQTSEGVAMLADPALPNWLKADVSHFAPLVAKTYAAHLGARPDPSLPLLIMGWRGPTPGKVINDGGVRPGEILLNFEGEGLLERNPRAARRTRWFIAHELAHFWLGSEGVGYASPSDAWITEGGADMMAFTLLAATDKDYAIGELQRAVDDCVKLGTRPIAQAGERHESRAFYACGTVFALAASGVARRNGGGDVFGFLSPLITRHRSDRRISTTAWLQYFNSSGGSVAASNAMRRMIEHGSDEPARDVAAILHAASIPFDVTAKGITLAPAAI